MTTESAVIELNDLTKTYDEAVPVHALRACSFEIGRGELVGIVGPSGSGKSTLLNMIGLLDAPTTGTLSIEGRPTAGLSDVEVSWLRGRHIGFVFQAFHLLEHRSAVENVSMALLYAGVPRRQRPKQALAALDAVGLSHRVASRPNQLSGGERQRLAIARALVTEPSLVLCDEPTGNLDSRNSESILTLLTQLNRDGRTVVIVTHDEQVAAACPRVLRVVDGTVTVHSRQRKVRSAR